MAEQLPTLFSLLNTEQTKQLAVVVEIPGVDLLTNRPIYTTIRYGDPIFYGEPGIFYGGLRKLGGVRDYIELERSSMTIAQRLEPEQGKGSISQVSMSFIDYRGYMSQVVSRGVIIPEILGRPVRIWLGYVGSSYPDDYFVVFRGVVTSVDSNPGSVVLQFSDANVKRRQQAFFTTQQPLAANIDAVQTNIPVLDTSEFYTQILGPNGLYDVNGPWNTDGTYNPTANRRTGVRTFLQIDTEYMEYGPLGALSTPSAVVGNVLYTTVNPNVFGITVAYLTGGTAGAEVVNVVGPTITVQIQAGVSTANQIIAAVLASGPATALVTPSLVAGSLTIQNVNFFVAHPATNDASITYTSGGPAIPNVSVIGNAITLNFSSGVTTTFQIVAAINSTPAVAALGVTASTTTPAVQTAPDGPVSIGALPQAAPLGPFIISHGFINVIRGARGTVADVHQLDASVSAAIEVTENCMTLALKLMLSGWNGPWVSNVAVYAVVSTGDPVLNDQPGSITLPLSIDAVRDYGLAVGDYVTLSDSPIPGNNLTSTIVRFGNANGQKNRIIYLANQTLLPEFPVVTPIPTVAAFRSQFDTYPVLVGAALPQSDIDVAQHILLRGQWFSDPGDDYRFFITATVDNLKQFIETQIYLPVSAYSLTRRGLLSVNITKPPLVQGNFIILNADNVLTPESIKISRATNNRKLFNEIDYVFDYSDSGTSQNALFILNVDALSLIGISVILPIDGQGVRSDLGSVPLLQNRANNLLARYKYGASIIDLKVNWEFGVQIEAGDIVCLQDNGKLQITNFDTGERDIGSQLFEVVNRSLDIKQAKCELQLISGIGLSITDRYGTVSPSSFIVSGTNDYLIIEDSFGAQYPGNEMQKYINLTGAAIVLHDATYSVSYATTITGFDLTNNYKIFISGFPGGLPGSFPGLILDIAPYPQSTKKITNSLEKALFVFFSSVVPIVSGASPTQFDVSAPNAAKFFPGLLIRIEKPDYSVFSGETDFKVESVVGTTITLAKPLLFTPDNTFVVTGAGFPDLTGSYRFIA